MVAVELRVISANKDGLLLELGNILIAHRFTLLRTRRSNTPEGVIMTLVAQGPEENLLSLEEQLGSHHMVNSFEAQLVDQNAPLGAPPAPTSSAPVNVPATAPTSSEVIDQKRIERLLPQLARDYPNVFDTLVSLDKSLDPAQRDATMRYIGARVGAWVFKRDFALGAQQSLHDSIARIAQPALKQLLPVRQEGPALITSDSPFATHPANTPQCHFIRGFLEGVLNESGHLGAVRVRETTCRSCRHESCAFVFQA